MQYGQGVSHVGELIDLAVDANIVEKSGAWYSYKNEKIGQGKENAKIYIKNNINIYKEIEDTVKKHYGLIKTNPTKK